MTHDRPFPSMALMLLFCALAPLGDGIAKLLGDLVPLAILLLVRFGVQAVLLAPLYQQARPPLSRRSWRLLV